MKYDKIDKNRMKQINMNIVLHEIRRAGSISRKDLASKVGLTAGTITNLVNECIENNIIFESGSGISAGGRKPIFVELNPNSGYIFGIELNVNRIVCVLVNFKAEIIDSIIEATEIERGPEFTVNQIASIIEFLQGKHSVNTDKIIGLGLVSSGPLNREKGIMIYPPNFTEWGIVHIKEMLEKRTGIKTLYEKDTSGAALGEYWFGDLNRSKKLFFLCVNNIGIGGGMVIDGDIYHGFNDNAADIGHIVVYSHGAKCKCGKKGCLEAIADGKAAVKMAYKRVDEGEDTILKGDSIDLNRIIKGAESSDWLCTEVIDQCAQYLNLAIITIIQMFSPDAILLGGEFFDNCEILFEKTMQELNELSYPPFIKEISIMRSTFRERSSAMGGAAMVFKSLQNI